jgi:hypothetical protein
MKEGRKETDIRRRSKKSGRRKAMHKERKKGRETETGKEIEEERKEWRMKGRDEDAGVTNSNTSLYPVTVDSTKRHYTPLIKWRSAPNHTAHVQCKFAL